MNNMKSPSLPLLTRLKLLLLHLIEYISSRSDGTINRRLFNLFHLKTSAPAKKCINNVHVSTSDVVIDPSRNLWLRLFTPARATGPLPLIVYFHGGGFNKYGPDTVYFDDMCSHLAARLLAVVASVNYRIAPEHRRYPSQYEDGFDALKFIDQRHNDFIYVNTDVRKCFIGGDSAGANIAHHVTVRAAEQADQFSQLRIAGMLALQPFFGGEERTDSELRLTKVPVLSVHATDAYWREFLPEGADRNHPAAHVFASGDEQFRNLDFPASLVVVGGNDPLQDWDRRYVEWLKGCGKRVVVAEYPYAFHGFYAFPELPEFKLLVDDVMDFIREQVNSS
ncbi:probable carboxylesterase 18 [Salvia splendens]|uniref:probable carboxylesterase 18 n=1 Tax=Salvia splendens TaxID=180675 RepID=UPI001C26D031|nr:probable carboxylesterase 18 [Salvia splendens]